MAPARRPVDMLFKKALIVAAAGSHHHQSVAFRSSAPHYQSHNDVWPLHSTFRQNNEECTITADQHHHSHPTPYPSMQTRIQDLISHPAVVWDESSTFASMHKKKLGRRHLELFDRTNDMDFTQHDHLFDQFAQTVCHAGVVARKEVFETWASALYIYSSFLGDAPNDVRLTRRVADIAAGHGLLAWSLLILDDEHQRSQHPQKNNAPLPLTAFCLDVQMPRSAELIQSSMIRKWPHLEGRFDYVEGRLEQLVPHSSCLLASVHACGILSDVLISTAAEQGVPLAVVPCCHSRKRKVLEVASPYAKSLYEDIILNTKGSIPDLADRLDGARMAALENAGLGVKEVFLPTLFTGKNRLIMGFPKAQIETSLKEIVENQSEGPLKQSLMRKGQMPPLSTSIIPKSRFLKGFCVPCEDTKENRQLVSKLAGRVAANKRKEVMHNRNHTKSPQMDLSLWLPEEDVGLSEEALTRMVESKHKVKCTVSTLGSVWVNPSGRRAQTFRFQYNNFDETTILSFEDAKIMHAQLYANIPKAFPGAECR